MRLSMNYLRRLSMLSLATLVLPTLAAAQQPPERQREATSGGTVGSGRGSTGTTRDIRFRIIKLRHNQATMVAMLLQEVLPTGVFKDNLRITSDVHSNSIVVAGIPEALQLVEQAIQELDVPEAAPDEGREPPAEIKVFMLQQVSAQDAAETLRSLYADQTASSSGARLRGGVSRGGRLAIAADERANSVIVSGSKEILATIEALLMRLDQPPSRDEDNVEVIQLQGEQADGAVDTLRKLGLSRLDVTADGRANRLILRGSRRSVDQAIELLSQIYKPRSETPDEVRLRVVWLVSPGLVSDDAPDPPQNLDRVLAALKSKAGVGELKLAAQFIVNASRRTAGGSQELSASGTASIQEIKTQLSVEGMLEESDGPHPRWQISVDAMQPLRSGDTAVVFAGNQQICQLRTTISAPPGHPVVLGMTPIDSMESVFVVELLPPDDAGDDEVVKPTPAGGSRSRR